MKFDCAKKGIYLVPATDADKSKFAKVTQGEIVQVEFDRKRNTQFHRKFFALLNIGFENNLLRAPCNITNTDQNHTKPNYEIKSIVPVLRSVKDSTNNSWSQSSH